MMCMCDVCVAGVFAYTWFKLKEQEADKKRRELESEAAEKTLRETKITMPESSKA